MKRIYWGLSLLSLLLPLHKAEIQATDKSRRSQELQIIHFAKLLPIKETNPKKEVACGVLVVLLCMCVCVWDLTCSWPLEFIFSVNKLISFWCLCAKTRYNEKKHNNLCSGSLYQHQINRTWGHLALASGLRLHDISRLFSDKESTGPGT